MMYDSKKEHPGEKCDRNACDRKQEISQDILDAARDGDQEAFKTLYDHSYPKVSVTVKSVIKNQDSAQDVIQEVYLKAFRELNKVKSSGRFIPWICRIAHNCAVNETRRRKEIPFSTFENVCSAPEEPEDTDADHLPDDVIIRREKTEKIREILDALPPEQRETAILYYLEERSVREIAGYLQISQNTVKSRLFYARKKVRCRVEELKEQGIELRSLPPFAFLAVLFRGEKAKAAGAETKTAFMRIAVSAVSFGMVVCTASFTTGEHFSAKPKQVYAEETGTDHADKEAGDAAEDRIDGDTEEGTTAGLYANMLRNDFACDLDDSLFGDEFERSMIRTVTFLNQMEDAPEEAVDVSYKQDGTVVAWVTAGADHLYDMYIAASGSVIAPETCENMFSNMTNLVSIDFSGNFDTSRTESTRYMFHGCTSLETLDVSGFDTSNVTDMASMFANCTSLRSIDLGDLNTSSVISLEAMFYNCSSLESIDVSRFSTANVETFSLMFAYCTSLKEINLSSFDTSSCTTFWQIFCGCESIRQLDLSTFDTANAENMGEMFALCSSLENLDVSSFDTSNVTTMEGMFFQCTSLTDLDLTSFDTSKVEDMSHMFSWSTALERVEISVFQTESLTNITHMFFETPDTLKNAFRSWADTVDTGLVESEEVFGGEDE